jgi:hypothetical protein
MSFLLSLQDHIDLSVWAFEKLADRKWGVIGKLEEDALRQELC